MDKQKCYNLFEFIQAGDQQEQNNLQLTNSSTIIFKEAAWILSSQ